MKRKIVSLLLALIVLCTGVMLVGCGDKQGASKPAEKSVADVINEALNKNENLDSMSAEMKMEMNMVAEGMTMSVPITAKIKAKNLKSDNKISFVDMTMSMLGQEIVIQMYQEGQWAYVVMGDIKYKSNINDMNDQLDYADSAKDILKEIPADLLKDVELVKGEDGSQTATISLPGDKFTEIYNELIKDMNSDAGADLSDIKISDAVVTINITDGYVTNYDIAFTMDMTIDGISSTTQAKATLTYENPGQPVIVTPPEGYQDFEELSMDDSLL